VDQHLQLCTSVGRTDQIRYLLQQGRLQDTRLTSVSRSPKGELGGGGVPLSQTRNLINGHPKLHLHWPWRALSLRTSMKPSWGSSRSAETPGSTRLPSPPADMQVPAPAGRVPFQGEEESQGLLWLGLLHFCSVPQLFSKHPVVFSCWLTGDHNLGTKHLAVDFCPRKFCVSLW